MRMLLALVMITNPLVARAASENSPVIEAVQRFDRHLEEILPSEPASHEARARAAVEIETRLEAIRKTPWFAAATARWVGGERAFGTEVETLADDFVTAFAEAVEGARSGGAEDHDRQEVNAHLGRALERLIDMFATRAVYPGSNGAVLWSGAFLSWSVVTVLYCWVYLAIIFTRFNGWDKVISENLATATGLLIGGGVSTIAAVAATKAGRALLMRAGNRPMKRREGDERLGRKFWARVQSNFGKDPRLTDFRPTATRASWPSYVFSRINAVGDGARGACAAWLTGEVPSGD